MTPIFYHLSKKPEVEGILLSSFYETNNTVVSEKDIKIKKNTVQYLINMEHEQNISKLNPRMYKKNLYHHPVEFISGGQAPFHSCSIPVYQL